MLRIALVLALLSGCDGETPGPPAAETPDEPTESEAEPGDPAESAEAQPAEGETDEGAEGEAAHYIADRPAAFFLVDGCYRATGASAEEALAECRRLSAADPSDGPSCCRRASLVEVTPDDPIAFYRGCCWGPGATAAEAHRSCEQRIAEGWCEPADPARVDVVTGPYERNADERPYEDVTEHRYLAFGPGGSGFEWVGASGEPPCFVAGTLVATPEGSTPIEALVEGDQVLTVEGDRLLAVPVLRVKARTVERVLALTLEGTTLRVTEEHPLRVNDRWFPARAIRVGDRLRTADGTVAVRRVALETGDRTVHALRVGAPHTYLAGGVLTHNY